ncbi:MAG: ABC transporter permease [Phycisphaerales bacterium]
MIASRDASGARLSTLLRRREAGLLLVLAATIATAALSSPAFLSGTNIADMLSACAPCVIVACGVALVVITGEIDISVGSMYGLLAAMIGLLSSPSHAGLATGAVVPLVLLAGAGLGLLNGVLVTFGRAPSIIVTLGALTILRGVTDIILQGAWITDLPDAMRAIGTATPLGLSTAVWTAAAVAVLTALFTRRSAAGLRLYAVGDNAEAARLARMGRPCERRARLLAFTLSGTLTSVAAIVSVPQLSVIESGMGVGFELLVITAVVVGGVSVQGGVGTIAGVVLAAVLLGIVRTSLVFMKLGPEAAYWERAIQGAFILGAVVVDHLTRARAAAAAPGSYLSHSAPRHAPDSAATPSLAGWGLLAIGCAALLIGAWASRPEFLSLATQRSLLPQVAELALLAVPMTLVILTGGIDLSVGSVMALSAVLTGIAFERGLGVWPAAGVGVATGLACGIINGLFITRANLHPLIVTLATMSLLRGLAEGISGAKPVSGFPDSFSSLATDRVMGVPVIMLPALAAFVVAALVMWRGVAGRHIRAIGYNQTAARYCGIAVARVSLWIYALSGAAAGLAAVMLIARRNTAKADAGLGIELDVITAVVLGGTSIAGGRGSLAGTLLAVLLLHQLRQFIAWRWYHDEYVLPVVGAVLIASVLAGRWPRRRRP